MKPIKAKLRYELLGKPEGKEYIVLGKRRDTLLVWDKEEFLELNKNHLDVKEIVKLDLPRFAYGATDSEHVLHEETGVTFEVKLMDEKTKTRTTIAEWKGIGVVIIGVIQEEYTYILYRPSLNREERVFIEDMSEVIIKRQGNWIVF